MPATAYDAGRRPCTAPGQVERRAAHRVGDVVELRLAFWVSLGIPISILGAIALMPGLGVSVNVLTLFGFVLVLGIVVDDAIIVGENIYRHQEEHGDGLRGSIEGAYEIAKPVTFAVLTTVAAFSPLLFVPGMLGGMFRGIPVVVIACLLFSLIESLNILPAHLAHIPKRVRPGPSGPWRRFQLIFANALTRLAHRVYRPLVESALRWRYLTASVGVGVMIVTVGMVLSGYPAIRVSMEAAASMSDRGQLLKECARILKPGGRISMTDWMPEDYREYIQPICDLWELPNLESPGGYAEKLRDAGLGHIEFSDIRHNTLPNARNLRRMSRIMRGALLFGRLPAAKLTEMEGMDRLSRAWLEGYYQVQRLFARKPTRPGFPH